MVDVQMQGNQTETASIPATVPITPLLDTSFAVLNPVVSASNDADSNGFTSPNIQPEHSFASQGRSPAEPAFHPPELAQFDAIESSVFRQRIGNVVVVLDQDGDPNGFAAHIASLLRLEGKCRAAVYLDGGLDLFAKHYPQLLYSHFPPRTSENLDVKFLSSLAGLPYFDP
eukprot:jgi/Hompol1/4224/HPOL_006991-RA